MYTSNPAEFESAKAECRINGVTFRIINEQFYKEQTNN